jgi:hypothetical protein
MPSFLRAIFHGVAVLALAGAGSAATPAVRFRTIYTLGGVAQPDSLYEVSPGLFYSSAGSNVFFTVDTKGTVSQIAPPPNAPSFSGPPLPAANGRAYAGIGNNQDKPENVVSVTTKPGDMIVYPQQTLDFTLNQTLPSGTLLGQGRGSGGVSSVATVDLLGNVTPVWALESWTRAIASNVLYASDSNYYGVDFTYLGGVSGGEGDGYVFRVTPSGTASTFLQLPPYSFSSGYAGWLLQGTDGNI